MGDKHVEFLEAVLVQQQVDAFAGRQFAAGVLGVDAPLAAAKPGLLSAFFQLLAECPSSRPPDPVS